MSGYNYNQMSNNAVAAYDNGEKPISKWNKKELLEKIKKIYPDIYELTKKQSVSILKETFLRKTSCHHTSKYYNTTDFYSFEEELNSDDIKEELTELYYVWDYMTGSTIATNITLNQVEKYKKQKNSTYAVDKMRFLKN